MKRNVILFFTISFLVVTMWNSSSVANASEMENKFDSLFVIASSGEVRFRDQNGPAMDSIASYGSTAVPFLIDKFKTKSARERWTVIWTLQRIGSEAVPQLIDALNRPDYLIVQRVCWALGEIKDSSAVDALQGVMSHSKWQVRERAVTALGKIGDSKAAESVQRHLQDNSEQVRKSSAVATGRLRIESGVSQLVNLLADDFYGARWTAAEALLKMDTVFVISLIADSIDSRRTLIGDLSCWVLGQFGGDDALNILSRQAKSEDPYRRAHAVTAIIEIDPLDNCGFIADFLKNEQDRLVRLKIESALAARSNGND